MHRNIFNERIQRRLSSRIFRYSSLRRLRIIFVLLYATFHAFRLSHHRALCVFVLYARERPDRVLRRRETNTQHCRNVSVTVALITKSYWVMTRLTRPPYWKGYRKKGNGSRKNIKINSRNINYSLPESGMQSFIDFKGSPDPAKGLQTIYVIVDEPTFMFTEFSEENLEKIAKKAAISEISINDIDDYDVASLLRELEDSYDSINLTDIEILRCATHCQSNDQKLYYDCLTSKSPPTFTRENSDVNRQLDVLMKGFPEAKATRPVEISFAETKNISSAGTSSRGGAKKKNSGFNTENDVREISGEEPTRSEGRLVEITNTWRDVKRALSLLCVKTFSSSAAMLEAPPGSREDLVEAARTPCTPTDLDTMLYGYTNSIYVLDHTPESLPDMDMLQLFASPAGRALVTGDNRPTTRGGSTSTSLSRESSSRAKSSRRTSSTFGVPTPPPRQRKSSAELYKEAVEILGLTCSLTDSCRCLDCQSNYFDCDDDCGDPRSELAAGTPILLDHALSHPLTCSIQ